MTLPNIIGITGYAQHGKNTVASALEEVGYRPLAFADALRALAERSNPYVLPDPQFPNRYSAMVTCYGYEEAKLKGDVRRYLQELGTGVRDILGPDAWVDALDRKVVAGEKYVITDVRFQNEARYVRRMWGSVWKVERPGFDNGIGTDHPSEAGIADIKAHMTLLNSGTVEDLRRTVLSIAALEAKTLVI